MSELPLARNSDSVYALSWRNAQDGMFVINSGLLTIEDANPAAEVMTGFSCAELKGMELTALIPATDHGRVRGELAGGRQHQANFFGSSIARKDGHLVPVQMFSSGIVDIDGSPRQILELRDISGFLAAEQQISAQNWALSAFSAAAAALGHAETPERLLQFICEAITAQRAYLLAWVGIAVESPEKRVRVAAASESGRRFLDGLHLTWDEGDPEGQGPTGVCIRSGEVQIIEDTEESATFWPWRQRARQFGVRSGISVPLNVEGWGRGDLVVYSALPNAFGAEAVAVFTRLASMTDRGIWALEQKKLLDAERVRLLAAQSHLSEALTASVFAMVAAMEARDAYTASHETRVADISVAIGRELGLSETMLEGLRLAAMVHDVGKIGIPSEILNKPTRLSNAEFGLVKEHPEIGYAILKNIPFAWPVADIVRQHHEKLDGTGYPLGLRADEILLESKVLAVADIVEAMGSDRPYRASLGIDAALKEIEGMAGTKLDVVVVEACCRLFRERKLALTGQNGT